MINLRLPEERAASFLAGNEHAAFEGKEGPMKEDRELKAGEWMDATVNGLQTRICLEKVIRLSRNVCRYEVSARGW